jgi:ABC-type Fe3+ transport system permease subunit
MAITNTWSVVQMDAYPEYEGEPDVVFTVHWTLTGTDGTYAGSVYGSQGITLAEGATFTPYADLTQAQVIGWAQDALGEEQVAAYEANVAQQIADQINPPVVTPPLPWSE